MVDFNKLKAPFDPSLIHWRVGAMSKDKTKAIALAYVDARDVMERLDEVCTPAGWQALYPHANGKTSCKIGIKIGDEWVWKENGAGDSDIEATKGAFSDAMKRAAVLWGIGRYLYDVPNIWFEVDEYKKFKNPKDPRFAKALEQAAKGIRNQGDETEPADEKKPETNAENKPELSPEKVQRAERFKTIKTALLDSKNYKDLNITWHINDAEIRKFPKNWVEDLEKIHKEMADKLNTLQAG